MFSFILHLYLYMQAVCMWLIRVQLIVHMQVSAMITVVDIANPPTTKGPPSKHHQPMAFWLPRCSYIEKYCGFHT